MRVLIVSYYFPPLGLAGTARPVALANFFASRGDEVFVVSVKPISYPAHDKVMESQIDPRVQVIRVGSTDPARIQHFMPMFSLKKLLGGKTKSAIASSMFPDSKIGFAPGATKAVAKLIQPDTRTLLITTSPPISSHLVGLECAESDNVTWIADFRDIWSSLPFQSDNAESQNRAENLIEHIIGKAALVTATSPNTTRFYADKYDATAKSMFLPNGYSEADFTTTSPLESNIIGIYGTLNYLIGFDRVAQWLGDFARSESQTNFSLRHIGHLDLPTLDDTLTAAGLTDRFHSTGYLPHPDAVAAIRRTAVNIVALTQDHDTSFVVPSKLWELLRAEPPLIAVLPKGNAAREILEERQFPGVWIVDDGSQLTEALKSVFESPDRFRGLRNNGHYADFEWTATFARLADRLKEIHE
ncbi:MAG: hypothetical protein IPH59_16380 [bacterium]|nr:hypothetical protein [bacterium]